MVSVKLQLLLKYVLSLEDNDNNVVKSNRRKEKINYLKIFLSSFY